jgi:hypothetical protein
LSAARILSPGQKWAFAEKALQHAEDALNTMVAIMHDRKRQRRLASWLPTKF